MRGNQHIWFSVVYTSTYRILIIMHKEQRREACNKSCSSRQLTFPLRYWTNSCMMQQKLDFEQHLVFLTEQSVTKYLCPGEIWNVLLVLSVLYSDLSHIAILTSQNHCTGLHHCMCVLCGQRSVWSLRMWLIMSCSGSFHPSLLHTSR